MYNIVLCDDQAIFNRYLHNILNEYFEEKNLDGNANIEEFTNGQDLLKRNGKEVIDIAFLDVEIGNTNGIKIGYELVEKNPDIVLFIITSYSSYLDDAMDLKVFRYLEKPVDKSRLFKALDIVTKGKNMVSFLSKHNEINLSENQIVCIYISQRQTKVVTNRGDEYVSNTEMKTWIDRFSQNSSFASPHYSYLVNLKYVTSISGKNVILECSTGKTITITASQRKMANFKKAFFKKMRDEM